MWSMTHLYNVRHVAFIHVRLIQICYMTLSYV